MIVVCFAAPAISTAAELLVHPSTVAANDLHDRRQLVVTWSHGDFRRDVTRAAVYRSSASAVVAVDATGYLSPVADGAASVEIEYDGVKITLPATVVAAGVDRPVHFVREIIPLLTRHGCNAGGCHGKASGQNNFKLSLFGFDPEFDYKALVAEARGRRVFPAAPESSLLLRKGAARTAHGGGRRWNPDEEPYRVVKRWIVQGCPREAANAPEVVGLEIHPTEAILAPNATQQLSVVVRYSDGVGRDVTRETQFDTNHELLAVADDAGLVRIQSATGEAAIMARYMGKVAVFKAMVPYGPPAADPDFTPVNFVDRLAMDKWRKLGIRPSPTASDAEFNRRVHLDLAGRLPSVDEVRAFLADTNPDKRSALVDRLLDSPEYASFFALKWGVILRNSNDAGSATAAFAFQNWLREHFAYNRPYDELVRGVLAASGDWRESPAVNWFWQIRDDELHFATADAAQLFLGLRLQCAQCHHHPYERWSQSDFYGLAGFFTRVKRKGSGEPMPIHFARANQRGERHPITGQTPKAKYLDGPELTIGPDEDPRHVLVDQMSRPTDPYFAKALVNRYWGHLFGKGIVDPVDDMRATNPPSNPELLDALAADFVEHKFDMKRVLRTIAVSATYQRSSAPIDANAADGRNFARYYAKRLIAEVVVDAVDDACGSKSNFGGGLLRGGRAVDLPHEGFGSQFFETFGRPKRSNTCECARSAGANLSQVLLLANSGEVEDKIAGDHSRVDKLMKANKTDREIVDELYLAAYGRYPADAERSRAESYLAAGLKRIPNASPADARRRGAEDLLWTLVNSKEFIFNH
ncbi:MAG: DUF1549 domain-containing protein [Planctomycetia bacterium]